jgi:hypothetical protein
MKKSFKHKTKAQLIDIIDSKYCGNKNGILTLDAIHTLDKEISPWQIEFNQIIRDDSKHLEYPENSPVYVRHNKGNYKIMTNCLSKNELVAIVEILENNYFNTDKYKFNCN